VERQRHRREIEQADGSLERVDGSEGAVQVSDDRGFTLQSQEAVGRLLNQFPRLDDEMLEKIVHHPPSPGR
jgi:hypothetical protein